MDTIRRHTREYGVDDYVTVYDNVLVLVDAT